MTPTKNNDNEIRTTLTAMRKHRIDYGLKISEIDQSAAYYESAAVLRKLGKRELEQATHHHECAVATAAARKVGLAPTLNPAQA